MVLSPPSLSAVGNFTLENTVLQKGGPHFYNVSLSLNLIYNNMPRKKGG